MTERMFTAGEVKLESVRNLVVERTCGICEAEMDAAGAERPYLYSCSKLGEIYSVRCEEL